MAAPDLFSIRTRWMPTLALCVPVYLTLEAIAPTALSMIEKAASSLGISAVAMLLARIAGVRAQDRLFKSWGGAPSEQVTSWADATLSTETKLAYAAACIALVSQHVPSLEEEQREPEAAHQRRRDVFAHVRVRLRRDDADGLWQKHLVDYAYARNLYGLAVPAALLAGACAVAAGVVLVVKGPAATAAWIALAVNLVIAGSVPLLLQRLENHVLYCARLYATEAVLAFIALAGRSAKGPS